MNRFSVGRRSLGRAMLRLLLRLFGLLTLAVAFAALVVDGTRSVANGAVVVLPLERSASALFPTGFEAFHGFFETNAPKLWDVAVAPTLRLPAWLIFGVVGLILFAVTRRRRPKIGYSRR